MLIVVFSGSAVPEENDENRNKGKELKVRSQSNGRINRMMKG